MADQVSTPRKRSLWPREHGAYVQLAAPLVTTFALDPPTIPAALIALGAILAFLANESLLVVLGHRGRRVRELLGARAWRVLIASASAAGLAGGIGLALAPASMLPIAAAVSVPAGLAVTFAWRRRAHTVTGELIAACALAGVAAPVAIASGASWSSALTLWAAWSVGFAATVAGVHRVIARHKRPASPLDAVLGAALLAVTILAITAALRWPLASCAAPLAAVSAFLVLRPPKATYLRAIGMSLAAATLLASGLVVALAA